MNPFYIFWCKFPFFSKSKSKLSSIFNLILCHKKHKWKELKKMNKRCTNTKIHRDLPCFHSFYQLLPKNWWKKRPWMKVFWPFTVPDINAEIAIASRFRQTQQSGFFFIVVTHFLHLMVPTGLSNGISTLSLHCKCLQGITETLQGNWSAGISNLWGLHVYPQSL